MVSARIKKVHHRDGGLTTQATRTKRGKNYEENGSVGFGDCDAGELGKRSECYDVYDWRVLYEHDELYECAGNRGEVR